MQREFITIAFANVEVRSAITLEADWFAKVLKGLHA
jgi:hypothetical protein